MDRSEVEEKGHACTQFSSGEETVDLLENERGEPYTQDEGSGEASQRRIRKVKKKKKGKEKSRRRPIGNIHKTSTFRQFLIDLFGRERLRCGAGVLDVAGGKGELSFQLTRLNYIPCTLVDPRPRYIKDLWVMQKRLCLGGFHNNLQYLKYVDSPRPGDDSVENNDLQDHKREEEPSMVCKQEEANESSALTSSAEESNRIRDMNLAPSSDKGKAREKRPIARIVTPEMAAACDASSMRVRHLRLFVDEGLRDAVLAGEETFVKFYREMRRAMERVRFGDKGLMMVRGDGSALRVQASNEGIRKSAQVIEAGEAEAREAGGDQGTLSLQGAIPTGCGFDMAGKRMIYPRIARTESEDKREVSDNGWPGEDPSRAFHALVNASVWVGLHPDQALGDMVDLALALQKPFAVVPCCVYSRQYQSRKIGKGRPVKSYDDLVEWVRQKDKRIRVSSLPFEGKNTVLFWDPAWT